MQPHLSNLQFFVVIVALVLAVFLTMAKIIDVRRRRRTPPFANYFDSNSDQDNRDPDSFDRSSSSGLAKWRAYNRYRVQAQETRHTTAHKSEWE